MTNMSSTATTFSSYPAGNDNSTKVLPTPHVTSTSGNMAQFQSKAVGGKRRRQRKSSKRQQKSAKRRSNKRTQKNRRQ